MNRQRPGQVDEDDLWAQRRRAAQGLRPFFRRVAPGSSARRYTPMPSAYSIAHGVLNFCVPAVVDPPPCVMR